MELRKLALLGAVMLLILGCAAAAGCTSVQENQGNQTKDPITRIWFSDYTDENGNHAKATLLVKDDGTGVCYDVFDDGTVSQTSLTWEQTDEGIYSIKAMNGESRIYTMNAAKDAITSSINALIIKMPALTDDTALMLGPWYNEKTKTVTVFNADGTGSIYKSPSVIGTFTWAVKDTGALNVSYLTGGFAGREALWTYDRENDVFYGDDGLFSVSRPLENVDGLIITS